MIVSSQVRLTFTNLDIVVVTPSGTFYCPSCPSKPPGSAHCPACIAADDLRPGDTITIPGGLLRGTIDQVKIESVVDGVISVTETFGG